MLFFIILIVIGIVSFLFALRSMRDFSESVSESGNEKFALYLFNGTAKEKMQLFALLIKESVKTLASFSIEELQKGDQHALAFYLPQSLVNSLTDYFLVELEEYVHNPEKPHPNPSVHQLQIKPENVYCQQVYVANKKINFPQIDTLSNDQYVVFQIVIKPEKADSFNLTLRFLISEADVSKRVELTKEIISELKKNSFELKDSVNQHQNYLDFLNRISVPYQDKAIRLKEQELNEIMKKS